MLRYLLVIMTFSFFSFANTPTPFNKQANILGNFSFTIAHTYDDSSNLLTTTKTLADGTVTTTSNTYDAFNRLVTSTDERGNKIKRTDIYGLETTYTYTNHNKITLTTYPDGSTESKTYDAMDNLLTQTNAEGETTNYAYDDADTT